MLLKKYYWRSLTFLPLYCSLSLSLTLSLPVSPTLFLSPSCSHFFHHCLTLSKLSLSLPNSLYHLYHSSLPPPFSLSHTSFSPTVLLSLLSILSLSAFYPLSLSHFSHTVQIRGLFHFSDTACFSDEIRRHGSIHLSE